MIEIQCTSCHTRYRIDERVLPDDTPTFKCSRCGHVFSTGPRLPKEKPLAQPAPDSPVTFAKPSARGAKPAFPARQTSPESKAAKEQDERASAEPPVEPKPAPPQSAPAQSATTRPGARASAPQASHSQPDFGPENEQSKEDGNLAFDFMEEPALEQDSLSESGPADDWKVGDEIATEEPRSGREEQGRAETPEQSARAPQAPSFETDTLSYTATSEKVPVVGRGRIHSSGFFLSAFCAVALLFTAAGIAIYCAPSASASILRRLPAIGSDFRVPVPLESKVRADKIQAFYQKLNGGQTGLVVTGQVRNGTEVPLHLVEITVRLFDPARGEVANESTFCGSTLSSKMIAEMTPHELSFLEGLAPQKNFALGPAEEASFALVFVDPPRKVSRFAVMVTKVAPAQANSTSTAAPQHL